MIVALIVLCALLVAIGYRYQKVSLKLAVVQEKLKNQEQLEQTFRLISHEAIERSNDSLMDVAQRDLTEKQNAIRLMVDKIDAQLRAVENERKVDQSAMKHQLTALIETEQQLKHETTKLAKALRSPAGRGRWGEIQLRRVVELAGMIQQCDFFEQGSQMSDGQRRKPDLIVRLPGDRQVVIDAKVPLESYLDGIETADETLRLEKFKTHARHVKDHITQLGKKGYWEHFKPTPEFVVLFLPSETIFGIAMEADPALMEYSALQGVILATPMTLIALLRGVAYGWKQESLSRYAERVSELGHELYKRIGDMSSHWTHLGKSLGNAVDAYNQATGSLERNVLSSARKFSELGAASTTAPLKEIEPLDSVPRSLSSTIPS